MRAFDTVVEAGRLFGRERGPLLGAGLAFHVLTSLAPLLLVALAVASLFVDVDDAGAEWRATIVHTLGTRAGRLAVDWVRIARESSAEATAIGTVLFIVGASRLYLGLRSAVQAIFEVEEDEGETGFVAWLKDTLRSRVRGTLVAIAAGLAFGAAVTAQVIAGRLASDLLPSGAAAAAIDAARVAVALLVLAAAFATLYRVLPERSVSRRHALLGGAVTALLLVGANALLELYFSHAGSFEAYGTAASLVAVLFWLVAASQVVLFGAAVTRVMMRQSEELRRREDRGELGETPTEPRPAEPEPSPA